MQLVFFGSSAYVLPIIEILKNHFDLALVITTEQKPTDAVPTYCLKHSISYLSVSSLSDPNFKFQISNFKFSLAVLADFGLIIPQSVLDIFPKGIINIHPSLLPKHRGPTPIQTAILNEETTIGVSLMRLDEDMDHGPILDQQTLKIQNEDTAQSLYTQAFTLGAQMLVSSIQVYLSGKLLPKEQDHTKATYTNRLTKQDGFVALSSLPSKEKLDIMIRALYPWPGVFTRIQIQGKGKIVKFLPNQKIQVEGKKPMSYKDFTNGYPSQKALIAMIQ